MGSINVFNWIKSGKFGTIYLNIPITSRNRRVKLKIVFNKDNLNSYADKSLAKLLSLHNFAKYDRIFPDFITSQAS